MLLDKPKRNWLSRTIKRLAASRPGSWFFSHTAHFLDRGLLKLTNGQRTLTEILAGVPVITVTTIGAKTGKLRPVPLLGIPDNDKIILIASNWGHSFHPAWYANLKANPQVTVTYQDRTERYRAEPASGNDRERCWSRAVEDYHGYAEYRRRAGSREIPIIILSPVQD